MTKFLKGVRTTNTPSWLIPWLPQQIQVGSGRHLLFRENVNNFGLDKDICTKFYRKMHRVTKSRNRKLIRVTSSNESLKDKCVSVTITDSWTKFGTHTVAVVTHAHVLQNFHTTWVRGVACQKQRLGPKLEGAGLGKHPKKLTPPMYFCNRWS